jgi:phosphopantetheinyl transferase
MYLHLRQQMFDNLVNRSSKMTTPSPIYWLIQIMTDVPVDNLWLTERERAVLERLRFPKRRSDWQLGRWTAKSLITAYLEKFTETPPSEIEIRAAEDGAPEVFFGDSPAPVNISISHRDGVGFCALSPAGTTPGCDLELIEPRSEVFVKDYFTEAEQKRVLKTPMKQKDHLTMLIWSAKESTLKALREGLRRDTRSVEVVFISIPKGGEWVAFTVQYRETNRQFYGWWRHRGKYILTVTAGCPIEKPVALKLASYPGHPTTG